MEDIKTPAYLDDEPDPMVCDDHHMVRPCRQCRIEYAADFAFDKMRDDQRDRDREFEQQMKDRRA